MSEAKNSHNAVRQERSAAQSGGATARLVYLVSQYPAANHTYILREVEALRARGFDVQVFSISDPDRAPERMTEREREEMQRAFYVKAQGFAGALCANVLTFFARPLRYLNGLACALCLNGLDLARLPSNLFYFIEAVIAGHQMRALGIAHAHTHYSSTVALFLSKVFPVTVSMTIHGSGEFRDPRGFQMREKVKASSFVCTISSYARSQIMETSAPEDWSKIELAPLGVDTEKFTPQMRDEMRREMFARASANRPFEIICVGTLARVKGQLILIEAVEKLLREGRDVRLRLVGDGADRKFLEREAARRGVSESVIFEGWRNQDEITNLYARADLFALASFAEGVPVVLMEAMALGLPCVATRITGVPELIREGVDGLLVPPSDVDAFAQAVARLMDDEALRRRLAANARARVVEHYDLERNAARLAEIFARRLAQLAPAPSHAALDKRAQSENAADEKHVGATPLRALMKGNE